MNKVKSVKVYSTLMCPYCKLEKSWLEEKGIKHTVSYVDKDQSEAVEMVRSTGQMGVPVTRVEFEDGDPEFIIGFDVPRLSGILGV